MSLREAPNVIYAMIKSFYQANTELTRHRWEEAYDIARQMDEAGERDAAQAKRNKADELYLKKMEVISDCEAEFKKNMAESQKKHARQAVRVSQCDNANKIADQLFSSNNPSKFESGRLAADEMMKQPTTVTRSRVTTPFSAL
ncbi:unnamed protein product [Orchesella dallaii]|uniref:Uncharacterized protein n=1 Tax=Orchesella dallaii TaxID=48710 RepID=A0ABP1S426_9HEXA